MSRPALDLESQDRGRSRATSGTRTKVAVRSEHRVQWPHSPGSSYAQMTTV